MKYYETELYFEKKKEYEEKLKELNEKINILEEERQKTAKEYNDYCNKWLRENSFSIYYDNDGQEIKTEEETVIGEDEEDEWI